MAAATGCGGGAQAAGPDSGTKTGASKAAGAGASAKPAKKAPKGPPMLLETIAPLDGSTVGVAMPVSVTFTNPVATSARAGIEKHLKVSTSVPVGGAWHWFSDTRADWRPEHYWKPGTKVRVDADLTDVPNGHGRYGVHGYHHAFTIGSDTEATVSVPGHSMTVKRAGKTVRTLPIDAGSPGFPSWDGVMAVIDKQKSVRMTSCSVGISCDKSSPDYYDLTLPWDVHLTTSGTYVHYSTGDPQPGHSYGSHGCVHLSLADAEWFYDYVKQGDPITITGSPRGNAKGDNGYADYNVTWKDWLAASANGVQPAAHLG